MSNLNQNQLRGYKAAVHNPNVSSPAKEHAHELLDNAGVSENPGSLHNWDQMHSQNQKNVANQNRAAQDNPDHFNNVIRGYKASLSNPNVSEEAKQHSEEFLRQHHAI